MIHRVILTFLVFGMVGCGVDVTDPGSVSGTYTLRSINGVALPVPTIHAGVNITAGSLILSQDLTCSISFTFTFTEGGTVSTEPGAYTYALDSGSITLTASDSGGVTSGSISGSTITLTESGSTITLTDPGVVVFRK